MSSEWREIVTASNRMATLTFRTSARTRPIASTFPGRPPRRSRRGGLQRLVPLSVRRERLPEVRYAGMCRQSVWRPGGEQFISYHRCNGLR
jgi:hypothetical protein